VGVVDKYIGDLAMVLFGTPLAPVPNPDELAVQCALLIRKAMEDWNAKRVSEGKDPVQIGIAIASGDLIVGSISSSDRDEYTVVGTPANLAAKIENEAGAGKILISENTYSRVHHLVSCKRMEIKMTEFDAPVVAYEVIEPLPKQKAA
jgi:adenylate cyclase